MRSSKPFWETGINPILGYKYENLSDIEYTKGQKLRVQIKNYNKNNEN